MLIVAAFTDLRRREVSCWLTLGGITVGVVVACTNGKDALSGSLLGMIVGGLIVFPFVVIGAFGTAKALLLATIGA